MIGKRKRLQKNELAQLIKARRFEDIFTEYLGWDLPDGDESVTVRLDGESFSVRIIAQKEGYPVCVCDMGENFDIPAARRRRFVRELSKLYYEHLLITVGDGGQRWSVAIRPQNRPLKLAEAEWSEVQDIQPLLEKLDGLIFGLSDENLLEGITDVVDRVHGAFIVNAEKVTKRFYNKFRDELSAFTEFVHGVQAQVSREWYAALMLNRLMFIYFIQKKGFLDGESDYLQRRLQETKKRWGKDKFHSHFYCHFLRRLFHEGLDVPVEKRTGDINELLGKVPYLNGGLFDTHPIEQDSEITIPDEAFERLFNFFDKYNWHLDDRPASSGVDINPDVIGYIFEKYINDRAEMGAYYTQEDITGYIARNTIIPFLLRRVQKKCPVAFAPNGGIWRILRNAPDNYIYPAVRHGCNLPDKELPDYIREGLDTKVLDLLDRRCRWNDPADPRFALPTETWREVIARRERYTVLRDKITAGGVCKIDDLVTHNLDIQRFTEDALSSCGNADFVQEFFIAIAGRGGIFGEAGNIGDVRGISVLDPACGSGAFLFAALRVLESLYERCVERISGFVAQDDRRLKNERKGHPKHSFFRAVLGKIDEHPNERYWIYKTIILHNLFGVDIMPEATEIAKLRLFLKLAAVAEYKPNEDNLGLEPLPDIDYNIRAGNSLVGFTNMKNFEWISGSQLKLAGDLLDKVKEDAGIVAKANKEFRRAQDEAWDSYVAAKKELADRLKDLNSTLDKYLARYCAEANTAKKLRVWKDSHKPFHWMADFYGIMENGGNGSGFDVIIGNPPYVEYSSVKNQYQIHGYSTEKCGNLYAMMIERAWELCYDRHIGMIVQLPIVCTDRMIPLQNLFLHEGVSSWFLNFDDRPAKLFADLQHIRASIFLMSPGSGDLFATRYKRWNTSVRSTIFENVALRSVKSHVLPGIFPKMEEEYGIEILNRLASFPKLVNYIFSGRKSERSEHTCYFHNAPQYWIRATNFIPHFWNERDGQKQSEHIKAVFLKNKKTATVICALLNSSLFYWWFIICSNCRDLVLREINNFPFNPNEVSEKHLRLLEGLVEDLMADYCRNTTRKETVYKTTGKVVYDEFHPGKSKHIMDKIDKVFAAHFGFTEEELDYIINYDIKYRMGRD